MFRLTVVYLFFLFLLFIECNQRPKEENSPKKQAESFLNCYLVQKNEFPEKSDSKIFNDCFPCYVKICNFPHLL
ncbi:hypothetical protein AB3N60_07470 [Leptospira sp. WS39.C2]